MVVVAENSGDSFGPNNGPNDSPSSGPNDSNGGGGGGNGGRGSFAPNDDPNVTEICPSRRVGHFKAPC